MQLQFNAILERFGFTTCWRLQSFNRWIWIMRPPVIQHKGRKLAKYWVPAETYKLTEIPSRTKLATNDVNCFCVMVDRRKAFSLISSRDHYQRSSPSQNSDKLRAGFEPPQNLSSQSLLSKVVQK